MSVAIFRRLIHLAWPVLISQVAVVANGVIDTVMAGRLSAVDLAAVGIAAAIYITVFVVCMGVLLALAPTVAQLYGAGRRAPSWLSTCWDWQPRCPSTPSSCSAWTWAPPVVPLRRR